MAQLDFGDSTEDAVLILKGVVQRMHDDLYNSNKDGLISQFRELRTKLITQQEDQRDRHSANIRRLNVIIALITALAAYLGLVHH